MNKKNIITGIVIVVIIIGVLMALMLSGVVGNVAQKTLGFSINETNSAVCENLADPAAKDTCYNIVAVNKKDSSFCEKISSNRQKDICFSGVNKQSQNTARAPISYDISDLGVKFTLPEEFSDLTHKIVKLSGDQAVNSVAFSSKRLESAGCGPEMAPLGYLTYDNDKGGVLVGHVSINNLYYIRPIGPCNADASLQNWQILENALKSLVSDVQK